jgi:hypothetical protein
MAPCYLIVVGDILFVPNADVLDGRLNAPALAPVEAQK